MKIVFSLTFLFTLLISAQSHSYSVYNEPPTIIGKIKTAILGEDKPQCINIFKGGMPLPKMFQDIDNVYLYFIFESSNSNIKEDKIRKKILTQFSNDFGNCNPKPQVSFVDNIDYKEIENKNNITYFISMRATDYMSDYVTKDNMSVLSFPYRNGFNSFEDKVNYKNFNKQIYIDFNGASLDEIEQSISSMIKKIPYSK